MKSDTQAMQEFAERYAQEIEDLFNYHAQIKRLKKLVGMLWEPMGRGADEVVGSANQGKKEEVGEFLINSFGISADDVGTAIDSAMKKYDAALTKSGKSTAHKKRVVLCHEIIRHFKLEHKIDQLIRGDETVSDKITFIDALEAQNAAQRRLERELRNLKKRYEEKKNLSEDETHRLRLLSQIIDGRNFPPEEGEKEKCEKPGYALDDTYVALRAQLRNLFSGKEPPRLINGQFGDAETVDGFSDDELSMAAVWGAITGDGITAPSVLDAIKYDEDNREIELPKPTARFSEAVTAAYSQVNTYAGLYKKVLQVMAEASDVNETGKLNARDWVEVTRSLIGQGVDDSAPSLQGRIRYAIEDRLAPSKKKVTATAEIIIPDLEQNTAREVQKVNLEAAQALYFAAMMDEARLFDVVDKLAELFQIGALPLEKGDAGEVLYDYIRKTPDRISAYERRNAYARVFGVAVGDPNATDAQFRNFDELWLRFVSAVSDWFRKSQVESLFATGGRYIPSQEQIRKTGLDLAANLSLYCYGGTWFIASELQQDISKYVNLLSSPEIKQLYGARDMWQVIDQVSVLEFGRPVNTIRARTMANAGATIIGWLEKNADRISQPGTELIDPGELRNPPHRSAANSINDPSDYDLVTACEQWLAIEGVGEDIVDVKAAASPSAVTSTAPVRVPPAAQEILGAFGFSHNSGPQPGAPTNGSGRA